MPDAPNLPDLSNIDLRALEEQLEAERWRRDRVGSGPTEVGEMIRRWAERCGIDCDALDELDDYELGRSALAYVLGRDGECIDAEVQKVLENPARDESFALDPEPEVLEGEVVADEEAPAE